MCVLTSICFLIEAEVKQLKNAQISEANSFMRFNKCAHLESQHPNKMQNCPTPESFLNKSHSPRANTVLNSVIVDDSGCWWTSEESYTKIFFVSWLIPSTIILKFIHVVGFIKVCSFYCKAGICCVTITICLSIHLLITFRLFQFGAVMNKTTVKHSHSFLGVCFYFSWGNTSGWNCWS